MPPKKGGKKGGAKGGKSSTSTDIAVTRVDEPTILENTDVPRYLLEGVGSKDRNVVIKTFDMFTPNGKTILLKDTDLRLISGCRYGIIGQNGIGKSTLLHSISKYQLPGFPSNLRVVHIQQEEIPDEDKKRCVLDYILESDEERRYLEGELEKLNHQFENDEIDEYEYEEKDTKYNSRLNEIASTAEGKAIKILEGLGFSEEMYRGPIKSLSGGWRMRVRLACALVITPDILLLDEPTNHLDFPAVEWLADFLCTYEPTLVIVSHDRGFLDRVMTHCIDFRDQKLTYYPGNYSSYLEQRTAFVSKHNRDCEINEKKRADLIKFISEARQNAHNDINMANLAAMRQKELDKIPVLEPIREDRSINFVFPDPGSLDHAISQCIDMSFHYDPTIDGVNKPYMLNDVNVHVDLKSRVGIMGANGAGKTTLINVLLGKYPPSVGKVTLNDQARTKVFTQHHLESLDESVSPLQFMMERFPLAKESQMRGFLGRFGMDKRLSEQQIGKLSGGQKSRVSFAYLTFQNPHLIILDEPTNHLDIETIESLIKAVKEYKGGVIVISHDRYFLSQIAEEYWGVNTNGQLKIFYDLEEAKDFSYKKLNFVIDAKKEAKLQRRVEAAELKEQQQEELKRQQRAAKKAEAATDLLKLSAANQKKQYHSDDEDDSPYVYHEKNSNKLSNHSKKENFSFDMLMDESESEEESEEEVVQVVKKAPKKKVLKKKGKKAAVDDDDDDMDAAFAALALDAEDAPMPTKKKGGKKKAKKVADDDDDDDDMASAFAALADDLDEEDIPQPKKKGGKKKAKKVADDDDDDDDMASAFAALAGDLDEEDIPQPKKKGGKKKAKKVVESEDDDDMASAFAALADDLDEEDIPQPKKKGGKKKAKKVVESEDDDDMASAFAALADDLDDDDDDDDVPRKKGGKKGKKTDNDDDGVVAKKRNTRNK